jgi:exodeoxyribonuclease VII small subunit
MQASPISSTPIDALSYEQAFSELESIIAALEDEGHSLEESLALFERGQALARHCTDQLDQAELKVKQLLDGELTDFKLEGE